MTDLYQMIPAREQINPRHSKAAADVAAYNSHNNRVVAAGVVVVDGGGCATGFVVLPSL
jgi:hypothetical protein